MRISVVCQFFAPEPDAPAARLLETARVWAADGHHVEVITAFPNHPTGILRAADRHRLFRKDRLHGIDVFRSWLFATPEGGFARKTLGHLTFMATAALVGGARARRPDVVVVSSPTFFSVISAWFLAARWRRPFVFEVRDLWPAIFTELGVLTNRGVISALTAAEMFLYRRAARVVTVTDGFRDDIVRRGIPSHRVATITNGVDTARFTPGGDRDAAKESLGLAGRFVVLYLGAHGVSHALHRVLDLAVRFRGDPEVTFLFVGEGSEKPGLVARAAGEGLPNVRFLAAVSKDRVPEIYRAADVGLVPLRSVPLFRTFIPSKMFELLACGVPVLGSVEGEAARILCESGGALVVPPEDVDAMEAALRRLRADRALGPALAARGTVHVRARYDRAVLARRYLDLLCEVTREARP